MVKRILIALSGLLIAGMPIFVDGSSGDSGDRKISTLLPESKLKKRNPAFSISVDIVRKRLEKTVETVLIDVRHREDFEKYRIPRSVNIPLYAIKSKVFLKAKDLILVNEGYSYRVLEQECERLRGVGFRVWIMEGGLHRWRADGAPLEGDGFSQMTLNRIPPRAFYGEKDYEHWIMIDVSGINRSGTRSLLPQSISMPLNGEGGFIEAFNMILSGRRESPFLYVLVFNENGEQYDRIEKVIQKTGSKNVFYLKGGVKAYRRFIEVQVAIRQGKNRPKKKRNRCGTCP